MALMHRDYLLTCCFLLSLVAYVACEDTPCAGADNLPASCKCHKIEDQGTAVVCINDGGPGLTELPENLPSDLVHLQLQGHNITTVNPVTYSHLTILRLANNSIKNLPQDVFKGLGKLAHLILSNNQITDIAAQVFNDLGELEFLKLDSNSISTIAAGAFDGLYMTKLYKIDLANNSIENTVGVFHNLNSLAELNMSGNSLQSFPEFGNSSVESLILDHNKIEMIGRDDLKSYPMLTTLSLHHNSISDISKDAFQSIPSLEDLYLEYNNISQIETGTFSNQSIIKSIRLTANNLTVLSRKAIPWNDHLQELRLDLNPWACTCNMIWLFNSSRHSPVYLSNYGSQHYSCASPEHLKGKPIYKVTAAELNCRQGMGHAQLIMIIGLVTAITLVLLLGWFIYTIRRRRKHAQYYRHSASSVYKKVTEPTFVVESSSLAFHDDDTRNLVYSDRNNKVTV